MKPLELGVVFPQTEIGADPIAVRDYAQAAEALGYTHLIAYDHVIGASARSYDSTRLTGPYREHDMFHEPMVLFGYLAGLTKTIKLCTGILILPQRQTALVAKQAAEADVLSGGRLRIGVGIGWNWVEYDVLGVPFKSRGARQEEQIRLLREFWSNPLVTFKGRFHNVEDSGINPLPVQRPIPIWLGGMAEPVLERIGTLADGWYPRFPTLDGIVTGNRPPVEKEPPRVTVERVFEYARKAGRNPEDIGIQGFITHNKLTPDQWAKAVANYRAVGATHLAFNTMKAGFTSVQQHIDGLRAFKAAV
jgi:probable F420-dependent oxidoreductase